MAEQRLKDLAGIKMPKFGHFIVEFATPGIGHILKSAGCDFVLFDLEHSGFGFETVKSAIRYFEAGDVPVIVRVPSKEYHHIARAMDMGAEGLMLPMVGSVAEARHILNSMKYTPDGGRGVALQVSHDRYRPGGVTDKFSAANKRSTIFGQIETAEGVENAEKIAALPGVDCLWVGHFDLSVSLGVPGDFGSKTFTDAITRANGSDTASDVLKKEFAFQLKSPHTRHYAQAFALDAYATLRRTTVNKGPAEMYGDKKTVPALSQRLSATARQ